MAARKTGLSTSDINTIKLTIKETMAPIATQVQTHGETLFGVTGGRMGLVSSVDLLEKHKSKMVIVVGAGAIILPAVGWAIGKFF